MKWHYTKDGEWPNVERPTDEHTLAHNVETCLVSYHFTTCPRFKHQDVFIFKMFREGEPEWRHNDNWCSPISDSIIVDTWVSLDEVYDYLWEQKED